MTSELKTCATCAHLIGIRERPEYWQGWKCGAPQNLKEEKVNVVTGLVERIYNLYSCELAREDREPSCGLSCGKSGAWWQEYVPAPIQYPQPAQNLKVPSKRISTVGITADDL
jgi:hypothetical protein